MTRTWRSRWSIDGVADVDADTDAGEGEVEGLWKGVGPGPGLGPGCGLVLVVIGECDLVGAFVSYNLVIGLQADL